jgi:hypothetical protein
VKASKIRSKSWEDPVEVVRNGAGNKASPTKLDVKASKIRSKSWEDPVEVVRNGAGNKASPTKPGREGVQEKENYE